MEQSNGGKVERWNGWTVKKLNVETVEWAKPDDWWNSWTIEQLNSGTFESEEVYLFNRSLLQLFHRETVLPLNRLTVHVLQRLTASNVLTFNRFNPFNSSPTQPFLRLTVLPLNGSTAEHVELPQPFFPFTVSLVNCSSFIFFTDIQVQPPQLFTSLTFQLFYRSTVPPLIRFNWSTVLLFNCFTD